jgi:ligand-binding sensor domain-containing protein/signal transduction histidine kinase
MIFCFAEVLATTCFGAEPKILDSSQVALEFDQRSWQHEHGLPPGNRILAILQTRDGYLWIGTQYGLARFDGYRFTVFDHVSTPALVNDDCRTLAEDTKGNLWIGTKQGLIRKAGNQFTPFTDKLGSHFMSYPPLCANGTGGVWVGGRGSVCRIRDNTVSIHLQDESMPLGSGVVTSLQEGETGCLWVGTETGFGRFDIKREQFEPCEKDSVVANLPVLDMWKAPGGDLWILFAELIPGAGAELPLAGIARLEKNQWPTAPAMREQWHELGWRGRFLVGDRDGASWLSAGAGKIRRYRNSGMEFLPMLGRGKDDFAVSALSDREGNLWVGTDDSGLQLWTPRIVSVYTIRDGLPHDNVWRIWEARDGGVWVGTDGGVTLFKDGQSITLRRPDGSVHKDVRAVAEDLDGNVWVGTMRSLECIRKGVTSRIEFPGEWFETKIRALQPGRDGSMWVGSVRGLTRLHKNERTKYTQAEGLGSDEVRAILEDHAGDLWVGTFGGGLSRMHDGRFTTLSNTNGLSSNNVWALHEDSEGVLWIGTDNGLSCFEDEHITTFTKAEGLPDLLVNFIVSDNFGRLWIGHDRGIYSVERKQLYEVARRKRTSVRTVMYDESDGLLSVETNGQKSYPTACKTRDGRIWFPTTQGVAIIDPAKVAGHEVVPLAAIEEVRANGEPVYGNSFQAPTSSKSDERLKLRNLDFLLLPGGARVMEFHYTANTFVAPEKARFKYRLVGLEDHWIDAGTRRQGYFTDLHPGDYRFEVIACNHHGVWQEKGAAVTFHVEPFYYQTWWFYTVCGLSFALLGGLAVSWRVRESRKIFELERINALNEQRRQIARDIHDELGASLTHIMHLSSQARGTPAQSDRPDLRAERIESIAGEAIDNIGEIVWANNPEFDTLEDLVAYLREYAANYFADTSIKLRFDFPETVPSRTVTGLFRRHLVLLMKESLQNVSKHAAANAVSVRVSLREGSLELSIADDGRGFPVDSTRRFGNGLTNMRQRVSELKGTFQLNSQAGEGAEIRVVVPMDDR